MDLVPETKKCFLARHFLKSFLIFIISGNAVNLYSALNSKALVFPNSISNTTVFQKEGIITGRIIMAGTHTPVCNADIFTTGKSSFTKSNQEGEFALGPVKFPVALRIRKFGFNEITIAIDNSSEKVQISLTPVDVHNSFSNMKKLLRYDLIFRKALEKIRTEFDDRPNENSQRKLVYCRISSAIDSTPCSFFESYARMNVSNNGIVDYQQEISRYASDFDTFPDLTQNNLEFKVDQYINLPVMTERFITRKGYFMQDSSLIAVIRVDLDKTINTYYINVADTSVIYITSSYIHPQQEKIPWSRPLWQKNKKSTSEISFSHLQGNSEKYIVEWAGTTGQFSLINKNKIKHTISKSQLFVVVSDSSAVCNEVRDQVSHEALTGINRQANFRARYLLSDKFSSFDSETEKLLSKTYLPGFWARNSLVLPDLKEQKQISVWENNKKFYSVDRLPPDKETISADSVVSVMNKNLVAVENVFIETDRTDYLAGDTIWFSAFILGNLHMDSTSLSRILYVDLINSENITEKHLKLIIRNGRTHGDFPINRAAKNCIYHLRAYTQYMRNFQGEYLFEKDIPVHQADFTKMILVNPFIRRSVIGDSVELHFKAIIPDEYQAQDKKLEVLAMLNDTLTVRRKFKIDKLLDESMGFFIPSSLSCPFVDIRLILSGQTVISEQRLSIPLKPGINLQFFPESGKMIDGIETVIAYKATDNKGNPTEFNADIINELNNIVKHISGDSTGVGKLILTPEYKHKYSAVVNIRGNRYSFSLPGVEPVGYIMNFDSDSGDIIIKNNLNFNKMRHYLLLSVRGVAYASINASLDNRPLKIHIPLIMYPKGIVQVTLYDSLFRPLAERLIFNNRRDEKIIVNVETDKKIYGLREKIDLTIKTTDADMNPVRSTLSLAVTDGSKTDSTVSNPDIESYLFIKSELNGIIDYKLLNLPDTTSQGNSKRDLVMMTQGWRNYLWNSIRYKNSYKILYPIEKGFNISGYVNNFNSQKPLGGYKINYLDFNTGFNGIADLDEYNRFKIDIPFHYNTHDFFIQSRSKKGRVENLCFVIDTFPIPPIPLRNNDLSFVSYKTGYIKTLNNKFSETDSTNSLAIKYRKLPEVTVTAKSDRSGYSAPDKTIDLDKNDPTGKKYLSLFQMIYAELGEKAFKATGFATKGKTFSPILVVNGAPLTTDLCPPCHDFAAYDWAMSIPSTEISEIKFYQAESKYSKWLTPPPPMPAMVKGLYMAPVDPKIYLPVVSIKTYSNTYRGNPRGAMMLAYQGIYHAREFYMPDHAKKNIDSPDNRTTIYWNPEIETDSTGTASVSFYNSDLNGKGLIKISGISFSLKNAFSTSAYFLSH
jgi:hypothetical protein